MSDISKRGGSDCDEGERGRRGPRGHDGATGPTGPAGTATGTTGPTGASSEGGGAPIIATALVDGRPPGDGFITSRGFGPYNRVGPGQYQLTLAGTPPPDTNCVVNVTLNTALSDTVNVVAGVSGGVVTVLIYAGIPIPSSPVFQDARFNVIVTDDR